MPKPRGHEEDRGPSYERVAYFSLAIPSHSVAIVKNPGGRSTHLPTSCDVCQKIISDYPFITKHSVHKKSHGARRRKYHVGCALDVGLVSLFPAST